MGQRGQDDAVTQALKIAGDMGRVAAYRPAKCAVRCGKDEISYKGTQPRNLCIGAFEKELISVD